MTIKKGLYEHFKGGWYHVIGTAIHTETEEEMIIYYHEGEPSKLWVRPASMWFERINGEPRFKFVSRDTIFII